MTDEQIIAKYGRANLETIRAAVGEGKAQDASCPPWSAKAKAAGSHGYGAISVNGKPKRAHRLSWELHHGVIPSGFVVCHSCDNPKCVRPDHLFLGSQKDNMNDMVSKGRQVARQGEQSGTSKLTNEQVQQIRSRYKSKQSTQTAMAKEYGVHPSQISRIVNGRWWQQSYQGEPIPKRKIVKRGTRQKKGQINQDVECACGCQASLPQFDKSGRPRRFIAGHNIQPRK